MSHKSDTIKVPDGSRTAAFSYECWANHQKEGLVNVEGHTPEDQLFLINNRVPVADALKQQEGLDRMRYCESQKNGLHTELHLTIDVSHGRVTAAFNVQASLTTQQLNEQGQNLHSQEMRHNMDLEGKSFGPQPQRFRNEPER